MIPICPFHFRGCGSLPSFYRRTVSEGSGSPRWLGSVILVSLSGPVRGACGGAGVVDGGCGGGRVGHEGGGEGRGEPGRRREGGGWSPGGMVAGPVLPG